MLATWFLHNYEHDVNPRTLMIARLVPDYVVADGDLYDSGAGNYTDTLSTSR